MLKPQLWLIRFVGVIVPRRFRARFRREWEAELEYREELLARWDRLDWRNKLELLWRCLGAFWDALWLQRQRWEDEMIQDIRFGVRMLLKHKAFTLIALLTLALGIGANTAIFSVANTMLLQPLPIKNADRLVNVYRPPGIYYTDYLELREQSSAVIDLFAAFTDELLLGASGEKAMVDGEAEEVLGMFVTGTYFSALGGNAALGRALTPQDDQAAAPAPVAVLSHRFWKNRFGAAPEIVGQTILLNGRAFTVVGVAEEDFTGVRRTVPDLWAPLLMRDQLNPQDKWLTRRGLGPLDLMGQLQPGVTLRQAEAALRMAFSQLKQDHPPFAPLRQQQIRLYPLTLASLEGPDGVQTITTVASVALAVVTLVLLIACLNVTGLMLARLAARQREIAVRLSLGASRLRLLRQLFTESLLLAVAGGLAGLLLSRWMAQALGNQVGVDRGVPLDWRALAYTLGISMFTAVVVGLTPAWQATRFDLLPALKQEGAGFNLRAPRLPLRSVLVVVQIALSLVLLLGAGLFARTLLRLATINPGFETKNLSVVEFRYRSPGSIGYDETRTWQFRQALQERLLASPMVKDLVWVGRVPIRFLFDDDPRKSVMYGLDASAFKADSNGADPAIRGTAGFAAQNVVTPNYFAALGIPLLSGRTFTEQELREGQAVVIINEVLARRHWQGENPVGKSLWVRNGIKEIIGVVKDNTLPNAANEPYLYFPAVKNQLDLRLLVKSNADPGALAATLRSTIHSLDPKLKFKARRYEDAMKSAFEPLRLGASLSSLAGLLALALAVMGLYGLTAFMVVQRTREIGVRLALGAQAADVVRLVLRQGLMLATIGVSVGLLLSVAATRVLASALYGISPSDPFTYGAITLLLGLVALLACWIPARRAARADPLADPIFLDLTLNWHVLGFTGGLAILTCLLFGLTPAISVTRMEPGELMKAAGRASFPPGFNWRSVLTVAQIALSLVLVAGALLFSRSLGKLLMVPVGFQPEGVLIAAIDFRKLALPPDRQSAFKVRLLDQVQAIPGVDSASFTLDVPFYSRGSGPIWMDGSQGRQRQVASRSRIGPDYFKTMRIQLLAGREFEARDRAGAPLVAIVNEAFAREFLNGGNPVGHSFWSEATPGMPETRYEIIGMVQDTKYGDLREDFRPIVYTTADQPNFVPGGRLLIRSRLPQAETVAAVKGILYEINPAVTVSFQGFKPMIEATILRERLMATLSGFFGLLALLLACVGLYGILSYGVASRTNEIGIRMALGAQGRNVRWLILREALLLLLVGVAIGLPLIVAVTRLAETLLYGLTPTDPVSLGLAVLLLSAVALLASYVPARRATRLDPLAALRE